MDPIPDLPPMNSDHFSDPSPPATSNLNHTHPPYAEMITAAITALNDKDGSSRQAISKYIEKEFPNLPPTHSTLLTHQLKRLKNLGQLIMVKHSYMLPSRSGHAQFQPMDSTEYKPALDFSGGGDVTDVNVDAVGFSVENSNSAPVSAKRGRGRPPKLKPVPNVNNQMGNVQGYGGGDDGSYQQQFQYHGQDLGGNYRSGSDFQGNSGGGSEPLFASLGLGDDGVVVPAVPQSENTPVTVKRGRGRPPKSGGSQALVAASGGGTEGAEAGALRPVRKANGVRVKRGRGRPKRVGFGAVTVPLSGNLLRPRGRPPKRVGRPSGVVNGGARAGVLGSKRRGRPSRNTISNMIGTPLENLSKGGPGTAVIVTDPRQLVVYQELKSKYEHLQSKVKQVAGVVKSCIDPDYGNAALGALQELEDLAAEVDAPTRDQAHQTAI